MRYTSLLLVLLLAACHNDTSAPVATDPPAAPAPAVFNESRGTKEIFSSSSYRSERGDVVEAMFAEELEHDTALAGVLERVQATRLRIGDSTEAYHRLNTNNTRFYDSAKGHCTQLGDTLERKIMNERIARSESRAKMLLNEWRDLDSAAQRLLYETEQARAMIMLDRVIHRMEAYQKDATPDQKGMRQEVETLRNLRNELRAQID